MSSDAKTRRPRFSCQRESPFMQAHTRAGTMAQDKIERRRLRTVVLVEYSIEQPPDHLQYRIVLRLGKDSSSRNIFENSRTLSPRCSVARRTPLLHVSPLVLRCDSKSALCSCFQRSWPTSQRASTGEALRSNGPRILESISRLGEYRCLHEPDSRTLS